MAANRKTDAIVTFNKVAVPPRQHAPNPFQSAADYLNAHVDDADGAIEIKHDKPGYALGKLRAAAAEGVSFRALIKDNTLTVWAQTRRPRVAKES